MITQAQAYLTQPIDKCKIPTEVSSTVLEAHFNSIRRKSMQINVLAKVIGERSVVGLIGFLYGDEGKIELAQELDSERLLSAVTSEANMDMRLKKASVLIATLKMSRDKIMANAKKTAAKEGDASPALKTYAAQIADLDKSIVTLQGTLDVMIAGHKNASMIVNSIQAQVSANLVNDQLTLTKKALNEIMAEQVQFTQDMVTALPKSNIGSKLRESVVEDVEEDGQLAESKLAVLQRLMAQQAETVSSAESLDADGEAVLAEIIKK